MEQLADTIRIGCTATGRDRKRYFETCTALEYGQTFFFPPQAKTLGRLRAQIPQGMVLTVRAWQVITHSAESPTYEKVSRQIKGDPAGFGGFAACPEVENALRNTVRAARRLGAAGIVFTTPSSFTPTASNRANLERFFGEQAPAACHGLPLIWEPAGIWSSQEVEGICADLAIIPCWDPLVRQTYPAGEQAYLKVSKGRLHPPGMSELMELAQGLRRYRQATCIFDTLSMFADAQRLMDIV